jgi:hypothetical protein
MGGRLFLIPFIYYNLLMTRRTSFSVIFAILILAITFGGLVWAGYYFFNHRTEHIFGTPASPTAGETYLADDTAKQTQAFRLGDIPAWLFLHVTIIASFQVLSVFFAALKSRKANLGNRDLAVIQFLIEIPMYLGLFGTLLGVCLTQFIAGTLVAPLAYLTTMSGILLHVFGKLSIWLSLAADNEED